MDKYYLVGIKGTGMSALAQYLIAQKNYVIGSDVDQTFFTETKLKNITILSFNEENIIKYKKYNFIISYAYDENNNVEVAKLQEFKIPFQYYSDFINQNTSGLKIGVSGTHGKTTTTKLITHLFKNDEIAYIIGDGSGGGVQKYKYFIFEACEYKYHFIKYDYDYLIINNIEYDHPDFYDNFNEVLTAFKKTSMKAKKIIVNNDSKANEIEHANKISFGIYNKSDVQCKILKANKKGYLININVKGNNYIYKIPFYGLHMIYNFLAAFTIYYFTHDEKINIDISKILKTFNLPSRRIEEVIIKNNNILIDDYAHHPTEIESVYNAIKQKYPNKEITIVFQPHTYSRTIFLNKQFIEVFKNKKGYLLDTFTAREDFDSVKEEIVKKTFENLEPYEENKIDDLLKLNNQIILFVGAGNIYQIYQKFKNKYC